MPNRYIRESINTSPNFSRIPVASQQYLVHTIVLCDDFGCFESTPEVVKGKCYALMFDVTIDDVKQWQADFEKQEMIFTWQVNGRQFSVYRTFPGHNTIRSLHQRKTPAPPADIEKKLVEAIEEWQKVYGDGQVKETKGMKVEK